MLLALIPLAGFVLCLRAFAAGDPTWEAEWEWIPSLGVDLGLRVDGLSMQFLLLITGIGALVFLYAAAYAASSARRLRLFALLSLFMAAMIGCVTADNLVALFVFWELTSLTSFLLVGFKHEYESSRAAARQALMVTGGGGLVLLAGIVLIGEAAGTYSVQSLIRASPDLLAHPSIPLALACVFVGAFTKSAQWPFHFWLPNAMAAPTPVSAYLHSATMVKLGVYLLARLKPAFGEHWLWEPALVSVGSVTAAWAMLLALRERDLKRILAWSTVSALGTLVVLVGLPGAPAAAATSAFLIAHALYKAPLFFVAGNVDHCTGTRSIDDLAGMARAMPWTATAAAMGGISMAGVPLSFGYVAKQLITIAKSEGEVVVWAGYATLLASAVSVAVAAVAAIRVFWHPGGAPLPGEVREASLPMVAAPLLASGLGIVLGLAPALTDTLVSASSQAMGSIVDPLALRSGVDAGSGGVATAAVFAVGAAVFFAWDRLHRLFERLSWLDGFGPLAAYESASKRLPALAAWVTQYLQSGSLTAYLSMSMGFAMLALVASSAAAWPIPLPSWSMPSWPALGAALAIVTAAISVTVVRDPFVMLLASGLGGLGSALLFLFLGAPDLALTQIAVEVAFVVVVAAVILRVRRLDLPPVVPSRRLPRAVLALAAGGIVAGLTLSAATPPLDPALPRYFIDKSVPEAHGRNVVNVIIVDFRAADTLGEITVVTMSFLAVLPLLRLLKARRAGAGGPR